MEIRNGSNKKTDANKPKISIETLFQEPFPISASFPLSIKPFSHYNIQEAKILCQMFLAVQET
jgi:hypothetical protein